MKNSFATKIIAVCAGIVCATASFAQLPQETKGLASEPVKVSKAWVRSTVPGQKGSGAFMTLTANAGTRLVGIASPVAGVAEVHEMKMDGDVMKMRALPALDLPAGTAVELKPGGYHVMLMDLKQPLTVGSTVPVTLMFRDGKGIESRQELKLPVASTAAGSAGSGATPAKSGKDGHAGHTP